VALVIKTTGFEDYIGGDGGSYIKMLIMGAAGAGKTRSASFWPKPIFADCEKGRMSIADRNVPYAEIRSVAEMDELLRMLHLESQKPLAARRFQTLVIDTLDSYQRTVIQERLRTERKESLSGWADWGYLDAKMTQFVERLLNLQMNIIVNLHTKDQRDGGEDDGILIVAPKLKGDLREQIAAEFDLVGHMGTSWEAEGGERVMRRAIRWKPEPKYPILKDRSGRLPQFTDIDFTDEDYGRIYFNIVGRDNFIDTLQESVIVETLDVPDPAAPLPPNVQGGQVAKPADLSPVAGKKAPVKKAAAKPVPGVMEVEDKGAPLPDANSTVVDASSGTATPVVTSLPTDEALTVEPEVEEIVTVDTETGEINPEDAVATVVETLGGTVLSETEAVDVPQVTGHICGAQPETFAGKNDPVQGCGKVIEDTNKMNIALLRTKTYLCPDCFDDWKAAN
jgi:AAA domain